MSEGNTDNPACRCCGAALESAVLDLGPVPICNRFAATPASGPEVALAMVSCRDCGLVQLRSAPPPALLVPRVPWIRYREPDAHLESVAAMLWDLLPPDRPAGPVEAVGLGPFEQPLLDRLAARGASVRTPDLLNVDREPDEPGHYPYLETWQKRLNANTLQSVVRDGSADIVSCRYLLEHCQSPRAALAAMGRLLRPDGLLVLEVPDSAKFLAAVDYCFPWEEHACYFVQETFVNSVVSSGFDLLALHRGPGRLEDALVGVFRRTDPRSQPRPIEKAEDLFSSYGAKFAGTRAFIQQHLRDLAGPDRTCVALFGAGHQAITFANALRVSHLIGKLIDDDPDKGGLFAPGFRVPIEGSESLFTSAEITTCLLAISPAAEPKIRQRFAALTERGVAFHSIYAGIPGSILEGRP